MAELAKTDRYVLGSAIALCVIVFVSSQKDNATATTPGADLAALEAKVGSQAELLERLKLRVETLELLNRVSESKYTVASFEPTSEGFLRLDSTLGAFAISIEDPVPYGDGTKLTINVGNPSFASYQGAKLIIDYGRKPDDQNPSDPIQRTKEHDLLKPIRAGSWNPNSVVLPAVKPDQLTYINVKIKTNQMQLQQ